MSHVPLDVLRELEGAVGAYLSVGTRLFMGK